LHLSFGCVNSRMRRIKTPLFPTYLPGVCPFLLDCHVGISLHLLTFQKLVRDLVLGQLPCIDLLLWLLQALEPHHSLLCGYDPPVCGVLKSFPESLGHVVVDQDPSLLECLAETLDVALCLCRVAAESVSS
jgi:hypothetical protein